MRIQNFGKPRFHANGFLRRAARAKSAAGPPRHVRCAFDHFNFLRPVQPLLASVLKLHSCGAYLEAVLDLLSRSFPLGS
jgi:hypothetical protein